MNRSNSSPRSFSTDQLRAALAGVGGPARPGYLTDIVAQAGRTRQRPAWTFLERWLPIYIAVRRQGVPRAAVVFAALLLLLALVAAGLVSISSHQTPPDRLLRLPTTPTAGPSLDPKVIELLNGFVQARIIGGGAQQYLSVPEERVPLIYATTKGAAYERGEFEQLSDIKWPRGSKAFKVRLLAGDSVVEQLFFVRPELRPIGLGYLRDAFGSDIASTTEDGQPVAEAWNAFDGEVTLQVAHPWAGWRWENDPYPYLEEQVGIRLLPVGSVAPAVDPYFGGSGDSPSINVKADPVLGGANCQTGPGYADAAELASLIGHYPGVEATAPVAVSAGTTKGVMFDVVIAAGTPITVPVDMEERVCDAQILGLLIDRNASSFLHDGVLTSAGSGERMRLYLFDVPEGLSMRTLAFAITASESDFERAVEAAVPVVNSIEFKAP